MTLSIGRPKSHQHIRLYQIATRNMDLQQEWESTQYRVYLRHVQLVDAQKHIRLPTAYRALTDVDRTAKHPDAIKVLQSVSVASKT